LALPRDETLTALGTLHLLKVDARILSGGIAYPHFVQTVRSAAITFSRLIFGLRGIGYVLPQMSRSVVVHRLADGSTNENLMAYRNLIANKFTRQLELPNQARTSPDFVPALQNEAILNGLTFRDVDELAHMEVPAFLGPRQLGEHVGPQIDVTLGSSLPHDLYVASILAQLLLFFMLVHFDAFVREAVSSPTFPAPGTLFSAFSRSRSGLFVFGAATLIPPLASALVLWASWASDSKFRIFSLSICTIFIVWAFFSLSNLFSGELGTSTL
jgi:hypothetical protein